MAANYLPYEPQQMLLLPQALQEWLPEGHLAHFISDAIDGTRFWAPFTHATTAMARATRRFIPAESARRQDRLEAIAAARTRLEQRQRDTDLERGRSDDDDQKPRGPHGKLKGGRYSCPFGVPQDKDQDNFTDPDSRIMQRAGSGFDPAYNAQTAVDDTAHIIVAADLINNASDVRELPTMVEAVKDALGAYAQQTLADAGYRSEAVFKALAGRTDLVVAIGREGKSHRAINEATLPLTAAMAAKMQTQDVRDAYRRRKWLAEPPNGWIKSVLGFRQFSMRGLHRVRAEWTLVCMALNLRRMATMQAG